MITRVLRSRVVQRFSAPLRHHLKAHTKRVVKSEIASTRDKLRDQLSGDVYLLAADLDALRKRTSVQATNLAGSVRYIESLTADVRGIGERLDAVSAQLADVVEQLAKLQARLDDVDDR